MRTSIVLASLGLALLAAANPGLAVAAPVIGAPSSLNFGNVLVGQSGNQTLTIQNNGDATLNVTALSFSGANAGMFGFQSTPSVPFTIPVGGLISFTMVFSPTSRGAKTASLSISSNDPVTPTKVVSLSGAGVAPVIGVPASLAFGNVNVFATGTLNLTISNTSSDTGQILTVSGLTFVGGDASQFSHSAAFPINIPPGGNSTVTVFFSPTTAGAKATTLQISSNDPVTPTKSLPVTGTGLAPVITAPASVDFGGVHIATTADLPVLVSNSGGANLSISSLSLGGANAASFSLVSPPATPINLGPGASTTITVRYAPSALGSMTASFTLASNDPVTPTKVVALSGLSIRPEPVIASIRDIPNDQGGKVKLSWDASTYDTQQSPIVDHYWLLRSVPPQAAKASPRLIAVQSATSTIYWELLATVQALHFISGYSYVAPTTSDSTAQSNPRTLFMVMALNADNTSHWDSAPDSGYSVDNLAPAQPAMFAGAYSGGATHLHWFPNSEPDLVGYRIYRGTSADFVPGPASWVADSPDTGYVDPGAAGSYYKLSAIDLHGNESQFALVTPGATIDVPGAVATPFAIAPPRPNPAIGSIQLVFALPEARTATLEVYDVQGRKVRTLVHGLRPAGWQSVPWDGRDDRGNTVSKGIFFVRVASAGQSSTAQFTFLR